MPSEAQAAAETIRMGQTRKVSRLHGAARLAGLGVALAAGLALSACGGGGLGLGGEDDPVVTAATPKTAEENNTLVSDQSIISSAVSSADIGSVGNSGVSWTNDDTGSRGSISSISEYAESGATCRRFVVSRESFDGVGLYDGDACLAGNGAWKLRAFKSM